MGVPEITKTCQKMQPALANPIAAAAPAFSGADNHPQPLAQQRLNKC